MANITNHTQKELTEKEAESTDLALEFLLTFNENFLIYTRTFFVFNKFEINNERAEFICEKLNILKVFELKHEGKQRASIHFSKLLITEFLAKGGMTDIWFERENKRLNIKLINKTLHEFKTTKLLAIIASIISGSVLILELVKACLL